MYLRIVHYKGQLLLYCYDGSIAIVTDDILRDLFVNHINVKKFCGIHGRWDTEAERMIDAPGHMVVYVNKSKVLCIVDSNPFCKRISDTTCNEYINMPEEKRKAQQE